MVKFQSAGSGEQQYGPECKRLNIGARAGGALHFNYLHVGLLRRVGVPDIVCAPRSPPRPIAAINDNRRWFWASLDRHIQRRTPSLHHSSRKSHCLCAAFACGGNLGPGVWFGLRFRLGSDCVSVSVEVPIGVRFGRNHTVVSQSCATCTLRRTALVGKCCQGHIQTIAPLSGASCCNTYGSPSATRAIINVRSFLHRQPVV